jgi:hypothetical protein
MKVLLLVLVLLSSLPVALGWGQVGHATVATIAQSLLHPAVRSHLCSLSISELSSVIDKRSEDIVLLRPAMLAIGAITRWMVSNGIDIMVLTAPWHPPFRCIRPASQRC